MTNLKVMIKLLTFKSHVRYPENCPPKKIVPPGQGWGFFIDLIKEHSIAFIGVNDSYLKTLLRDYAPSAIQATKRVKTDSKYEEANLLAADTICG